MKYEKPVVMMNSELAEGVFAASGSSDCWDVTAKTTQEWSGSHHIFEANAIHQKGNKHISSNVKYVFTFSKPLTDAYSEFPSTFAGNTLTVNRTLLGDAYQSGDNATFKVWAQASTEAETKALTISGITWLCTHETNVQGELD